MTQRNVLTIFLASPGDLQPERDEAQKVAARLNKSVASHLNWQIDLLGWEDTSPGYARPQAKINDDVDKCDLFIGVVWKRWGQPTGTHTSGFHEELERALERRRKTQAPEIWLFFKEVSADQLIDPGEQLRSVLAFKEIQIERRELLYQEFRDKEQWSNKVNDWLAQHIIRLSKASEAPASESSAPIQSEAPHPAQQPDLGDEREAASSQISRVLTNFNATLHQGTESSRGNEKIDHWDIARLNLFSTAHLSDGYSHDILSVHEINLLYQNRQKLKPLQLERTALLRTIIGNSDTTAPGWFWFQFSRSNYILFLISAISTTDLNIEVKKSAIRLLGSASRLPDKRFFDHKAFISSLLKEGTREASEYIGSVGHLRDVPVLDGIDTPAAREAKICILARHKPTEALEELLNQPAALSARALGRLQAKAPEFTDEILHRSLGSPFLSLRVLSFRELKRRGNIDLTIATNGLQDKSKEIRALSIDWLISEGLDVNQQQIRELLKESSPTSYWQQSGNQLSDPDDVIRQYFSHFSEPQLNELISWNDLDGANAYQVLAETKFNIFGNVIREDLRSAFSRIKNAWIESTKVLAGTGADKIIESFSEFDNFFRDRYTAAALSALGKNGDSSDREIVRQHLKSNYSSAALAAVGALSQLGSKEDSRELTVLALSGNALLAQPAAAAAVRLSPGINGPAADLLSSGNVRLVEIALQSLERERLNEVAESVEALLLHNQDRIRERALAFLVKKASKKYLVALLERYLSRDSYFYNVVCHLDRVLYAPQPFQGHFRKTLVGVLDSR